MQVKVAAFFCLIQTSIGPEGLVAPPFSVFSVIGRFIPFLLNWPGCRTFADTSLLRGPCTDKPPV